MLKDIEYWNSKEHKISCAYLKGTATWKKQFISLIWSYHDSFRRDFSWRNNITPYRVLVSEFMLQQTQTSRVKDKFQQFIRLFPSIRSLAEAQTAEVLRAWSGLGYNRRALFLHDSAKFIRSQYQGRVPKEREVLLSLPGIGSGTAAAIRVFAYNIPDVIIETNIRTVYRKVFFPEKFNISDSDLAPLLEATIDIHNPREWFYALMDYGVFLKQHGYQVNRVFKGYRLQSRFQGSRRQVRGEILRMLLQEEKISKRKVYKELQSGFNKKKDEIISVCLELEKEGLIERNRHFLLLV